MSNIQETCKEVLEDLTPLEVSRDLYLATQVKSKIEEVNKTYEKEFDEIIGIFERQILNDKRQDLSSLLSSVKRFSDTISSMYSALIKEIDRYQKNFFK